MRNSSLALAALLLVACGDPPPPPPTIILAETADTLILPVVNVSAAVPLSGGRYALLALVENRVYLGDFTAKTLLAFPGMTPAEVTKPSVIFGDADTVVVGDWGLQRFTRWTPGQPRLEAIPAPAALRGVLPRGHDAAGRWYFQVPPRSGVNGEGNRDSTVIVRSDPLLTRFDTLAKLAPPDLVAVEDGYGRSLVPRALGGEDRWGVLGDGTVWVARHHQNRIDRYAPDGTPGVKGKPLPDPVLALSDMDKEIYIRRYPADQQENARMNTQWSPVKPPFERVFPTADGRMWLFKSAPALDSIRKFQVVEDNKVLKMVGVPSRGIALSVTMDEILMGEEFPGGIRLLRYIIPK